MWLEGCFPFLMRSQWAALCDKRIKKLQKILFVLVREGGAEDVQSCSAAFRTCQDNIWIRPKEDVLHCHLHFLFRMHPAWTCFVFRNQCRLPEARLPYLILCSSCVAGLLLPLGTAISISHCFSILTPWALGSMGSPAEAEHPALLLRNACGMSPLGAGFTGGEPKEVRSPSQAPHPPPALVAAGCLCKVIIHAY